MVSSSLSANLDYSTSPFIDYQGLNFVTRLEFLIIFGQLGFWSIDDKRSILLVSTSYIVDVTFSRSSLISFQFSDSMSHGELGLKVVGGYDDLGRS